MWSMGKPEYYPSHAYIGVNRRHEVRYSGLTTDEAHIIGEPVNIMEVGFIGAAYGGGLWRRLTEVIP